MILYYDYILTFTREVESFWPHRNRVGFVSSIYFLNRYVAIFGHIPMVLRLVVLESFFIVGVSLTLLTFSCLCLVTYSMNGYLPLSPIHQPLADFLIRCRRLHRYIGYLGMVLQFLGASEPSQHILQDLLTILATCATRVYALYNKDRCIFTGLIALMVASIAVGIVMILR